MGDDTATIWSDIGGWFDSAFNALGGAISTATSQVLSPLNDLKDNVIGFFTDFWDNLTTFITDLFIPNSEYMTTKQAEHQALISSKFGNLTDININQVSSAESDITIPFIYGATISLAWFAPYAAPFKSLFSGLLYALTLFYIINRMGDMYS